MTATNVSTICLKRQLSFCHVPHHQRCGGLCDCSKSVLLPHAMNPVAWSTFQSAASGLAYVNLNTPHALTLASAATKLLPVCLPAAPPGFLSSETKTSYLLALRAKRSRDTGRLPAGLWHDLCAPAKGNLWEALEVHQGATGHGHPEAPLSLRAARV